MNKLAHAAALDRLRWLDPSTLPALAVELLLEGVESKSLVLLAGEPPGSDPVELRALFDDALHELSIPMPTRLAAARALKVKTAGEVVSGQLPPREGARQIVELSHEVGDETRDGGYAGSGFGIAELLGLYYAYDDICHRPADEQAVQEKELGAAIVAACERIVSGEEGSDPRS